MNDSKEQTLTGLRVPLAKPWFSEAEVEAAADVVRSGWVVFGPRVKEFEAAFADLLGAKHAIAVNSGSSAILVALWAMGVRPGDEIIVPDMTFISTATAALFLGARPVFADISLDTYCIDPGVVEGLIGPKTKAIVPVHYAGHSADMRPLLEISERRGVAILEDSAESHLARYEGGAYTGTLGRAGIFSFTPSKLMTTGEGGLIVTDDDETAEKCRLFRNFGDSDKFQWDQLGFNFRMPEVMGAMGLEQLQKLPEAVSRRHAIANRYNEAFSTRTELILPPERRAEDTNYQLYTLRLQSEAGLSGSEMIGRLLHAGVSSRLYYPPLHKAGVFAGMVNQTDGDFPNTILYERTAFSLPIFPTLTSDDQSHVIRSVLSILDEVSR